MIFVAPAGRRRYKICLTLDCGKRLFGSPDKTERLIADLHRGSAGFIHLLRSVGIEVGQGDRTTNPFRGDVLQLGADNGKNGCEQNAPVSPDKDEVAHIGYRLGRLRFRLRAGGSEIPPAVSRVGGLLRRDRLLNHDNLRLRLRLLDRLLPRRLVLLIVALVIVAVGIAKQYRHDGTLSAMSVVSEVGRRVVAERSTDRRQMREVKSQTGHARKAVRAERVCGWGKA